MTKEQIARAALEIGLDRATVRNVADALGMSVPGLYHHVRTREQLLALAAAHSLGSMRLPRDRGQSFRDWLLAYARSIHDALVAQPQLIHQLLSGSVDTIRMAQHLERVLAVASVRGIDDADAHRAYRLLTSAVIGAAASEISRRESRGNTVPLSDAARRLHDAAPHVRRLAERGVLDAPADPFELVELVVNEVCRRPGS